MARAHASAAEQFIDAATIREIGAARPILEL
jgi:hypothetical protein